MKRCYPIACGLIVLPLWTAAAHADQFIPFGTPSIDGEINSSEWPELGHLRMARFYGFDQFTDLWLQWDDDHLYVAGVMQDATLNEDGHGGSTQLWETWHDDSLEIYVHPGDNPPAIPNERSRMIALTARGRFQSFNRGKWLNDVGVTSAFTGLETLANTTAKITHFLNQPIDQQWVCPVEQPNAPPVSATVTVKFAHRQNAGEDWRIEMAIPWSLLGTRIGIKVVGANCALGQGIFPDRLTVGNGSVLHMNFLRVNDDDGGALNPRFTGTMTDALGNNAPDGVMLDDWVVYQGDRHQPNEWVRFVLSDSRQNSAGPVFKQTTLQATPLLADGRRVKLSFNAAQRSTQHAVAVHHYEVRYQLGNGAITASNWNSLPVFEQAHVPAAPNTPETLEVIGLQPGQTYRFGVRAVDERGHLSADVLTAVAVTSAASEPFVTVAPTGRNFVLSDGRPFVVAGETALMPWLPLRGLFDEALCDEYAPNFLKNPPSEFKLPVPPRCGQGLLDKSGKPIDGVMRNYHSEDIFYRCHYTDGSQQVIARLTATDKPIDNCSHVTVAKGRTLRSDMPRNPEPMAGPYDAEQYFATLQAHGVNVLTVFVESLDIDATPIMFQKSSRTFNDAALRFLDRLVALAKKHQVYLIFRVYDDFYYKDDRYGKGDFRKWTDTFWFTELRKMTPDQFFDEDLYSLHQQRLSALMHRYRDEAHVMGWDILNEIDNKVRFNAVSLTQRRKWLDTMLAHAKAINPNQLIFYSFLAWDPKDDSVYRTPIGQLDRNGFVISQKEYIGMDAETAYRIPRADVAMPHAYYAHVANPWQIPPRDFEPYAEMMRGISYGFYQIRDGRPILDGESSPNTHLYQKYYGSDGFTEAQDNENFLRMSWLHFVAGGAGANLTWPANLDLNIQSGINQLNPTKRGYLKIFQETVGQIPWRGDLMQIQQRKLTARARLVTRFDHDSAVAYLVNPARESLVQFTLTELPPGPADVKIIDPVTGQVRYQAQTAVGLGNALRLPAPLQGDAVIVVRNLSSQAPQPGACTSRLNSRRDLDLPCVIVDGKAYATRLDFIGDAQQLAWRWPETLSASACPVDPNQCVSVASNLDLSLRNVDLGGVRYRAQLAYRPTAGVNFRWHYRSHQPE